MKLMEVFDNPYSYNWTTADPGKYVAEFKTEDGSAVQWQAYHDVEQDHWDVEFKRGGKYAKSEAKDHVKILSTVVEITKDFIKSAKPWTIYFTADKIEDGEETGRAKLYNTILKRFATGMGYSFDAKDMGRATMFKMERT